MASTAGINEMNEIIENVIKSRMDGIVVYNDYLKPEELTTLTDYNIPIVYVGNRMSADNICSVYIDYEKAIKNLVSDYLKRGIEDIVLIQDRKSQFMMEQLIKGWDDA